MRYDMIYHAFNKNEISISTQLEMMKKYQYFPVANDLTVYIDE